MLYSIILCLYLYFEENLCMILTLFFVSNLKILVHFKPHKGIDILPREACYS